jgi:hypothetical protein
LEAENEQLKVGGPVVAVSVDENRGGLQAEIDRLNAELDTANRRADLLESDLARLRAVQAETQQRLTELSISPTPSTSSSMELEVPSSNVSSSGESDSSSESGASKELAPKNLMMALLMLLSPVLSHERHSESQSHSMIAQSSSYSLFPGAQMGSGFIPATPFEQFLKPDPLAAFDPTSFYTTTDLDMNGELNFNMGAVQQSNFVTSVATSSFESGYGELDLLKSSMEVTVPANEPSEVKPTLELDVELLRDSQDPSKVRVRLAAPSSSSSTSSLTLANLPHDFLGFPPSPISGLDGITYSYTTAGQGTERKRVRLSLDSNQGWNVHAEDC